MASLNSLVDPEFTPGGRVDAEFTSPGRVDAEFPAVTASAAVTIVPWPLQFVGPRRRRRESV
jgi:hypothetical protein